MDVTTVLTARAFMGAQVHANLNHNIQLQLCVAFKQHVFATKLHLVEMRRRRVSWMGKLEEGLGGKSKRRAKNKMINADRGYV